jgi:hypothetical protein
MNAAAEFTKLAREAHDLAERLSLKWDEKEDPKTSIDPLAVEWRKKRRAMDAITPEMIVESWREETIAHLYDLLG